MSWNKSLPDYTYKKKKMSKEEFLKEYPVEAKEWFKKLNMQEYAKYLEYRKDQKRKLSFEEFKKNHKHRYFLWLKRNRLVTWKGKDGTRISFVPCKQFER